MLLQMRYFVYFRSGRSLFTLYSSVYLAVGQISTAANIRNYTQDIFVNLRFKYERRGHNEPTRLNVFCC